MCARSRPTRFLLLKYCTPILSIAQPLQTPVSAYLLDSNIRPLDSRVPLLVTYVPFRLARGFNGDAQNARDSKNYARTVMDLLKTR